MQIKAHDLPDNPLWLNPDTDSRNVADEFKGLTTETIRMSMQKRRVPAINVTMNLTHDFNKSSVLRANEVYAFKEFVLVNRVNEQDPTNPEGVKHFDARGAVGMRSYANIRHVTDWQKLFDEYHAEGYTIYAVDNMLEYNPKALYNVDMPEKSVFVYGEESLGLSEDVIKACDAVIYIPQFGIPRSLNIAQAAATVMYEYARQHKPILD